MWIYSTIGQFSFVRKEPDEHLTVRARVKTDLDRLRELTEYLGPTQTHVGTDYPYRATIQCYHLAMVFGKLITAIDYPNFKNEVSAIDGPGRSEVYGSVWAHTMRLEGLNDDDDL